jgi:hypothetical protein
LNKNEILVEQPPHSIFDSTVGCKGRNFCPEAKL